MNCNDYHAMDDKIVSRLCCFPISQVNFPFHDPYFLSMAGNRLDVRSFTINNISTLIKINSDLPYAECLLSGSPFAGNFSDIKEKDFQKILHKIQSEMGKPIYFPLVYNEDPTVHMFTKLQAITWNRLPSPVVLAASLRSGLTERAAQRIGKRAYRRIKRFKESGAVVINASGQKAFEYIEIIEKSSWKAALKQDIFSRDQAYIYNALINSSNTKVRVAMLDGCPISYRLDYKADKIVYALKWSFVEAQRKHSPGFYLLVQDLFDTWGNSEIDCIDLHGSIDSLKLSICEENLNRKRFDFIWPPHSIDIQSLKENRLDHDYRLAESARNGNGIRKIYQ